MVTHRIFMVITILVAASAAVARPAVGSLSTLNTWTSSQDFFIGFDSRVAQKVWLPRADGQVRDVRRIEVVMIGNNTPTVDTFGMSILSGARGDGSWHDRPGSPILTRTRASSVALAGSVSGTVYRKWKVTFNLPAGTLRGRTGPIFLAPFAKNADAFAWGWAHSTTQVGLDDGQYWVNPAYPLSQTWMWGSDPDLLRFAYRITTE